MIFFNFPRTGTRSCRKLKKIIWLHKNPKKFLPPEKIREKRAREKTRFADSAVFLLTQRKFLLTERKKQLNQRKNRLVSDNFR